MKWICIALLTAISMSMFGQQTKPAEKQILDSAGNVSVVMVFNKAKMARLDGYWIEGYLFDIGEEEAKRLDGKKIRMYGRYTVVKGLNNLPKEYDKNGTVLQKQGREEDYKYIDKPQIKTIAVH